jgi:hypothetical protein
VESRKERLIVIGGVAGRRRGRRENSICRSFGNSPDRFDTLATALYARMTIGGGITKSYGSSIMLVAKEA